MGFDRKLYTKGLPILILLLFVSNDLLAIKKLKSDSTPKTGVNQTGVATENTDSQESSYFLNLPLSFGAGFFGTMVGMTATTIFIGMPVLSITGDCKFKLSGHSSGAGGCTEAGYNSQNVILSAGGILGAFVSVHFVSKWLGLRHKWWQTLIGATIGIFPFSYYYYYVQRGTIDSVPTGGSDNPHLDYGIVSVVVGAMLFTYAGSLFQELRNSVAQVEMRPTGAAATTEIYGKIGYRFRF